MSRGQTRRTSTTTEAESYLRLALSSGLLSDNPSQVLRATTENYALDSYQNLLFSIARFHEYTGHYPRYITIIGYEMKRRRFEELHRAALRWPRSNFDYLGIDAEGEEAIGAIEGEVTYILQVCTSLPSSPYFSETKWLSTLYPRHVWMPWSPTIKTSLKKPIHAIPFILYIVTRAWCSHELVSWAHRRGTDSRI